MPSFVVNGALTLSGDPTAPNQVATKGYVDSKVTNMDASHVGGVAPLAGARMPALSGDLIANQGNTTLTLAPTGVVAGSYTKVRTDANGRIVEGVSTVVDDYSAYISFTNILPVSRPNSLAGYGITEAVRTDGTTMTGVLSLGSSSFAATELVTKGYVDSSRDTALYGKTISAGDIFIRPSTIAPTGYLRCNGGLVSKMAYPDLYAVIGDGSPVQLSDYGNGRPWEQQYNINTTQNTDIVGWSGGVSLPGSILHSQFIITVNRIYCLGGIRLSDSQYLSTVYTAPINTDGTLGSWNTGPSLPIPIASSHSVVVRNRVYLIGGATATNPSGYLSTVYTAPINTDGTLGSWNTGPSLPTAIVNAQVAVIKNRIFLFGGVDNNDYLSTVYTAPINTDGTLGSWNTGPSLPSKIAYGQIAVVKNRVHLLGGHNGTNRVSTVYTAPINADGTLGSWSTSTSLPIAIAQAQVFVTTGKIYLLGGNDGSSFLSTVYTAPINADGTLGSWTVGTALPGNSTFGQVAVVKNRIYLFGVDHPTYTTASYTATISGGLNDYSPYYAIPVENVYNTGKPWQQHYDQNTDQVSGISSWTAGTSLPAAIKNAQAVVTKDRVYLIGGTNGTTTLTSVYTASVAADGTLGAWSAATSLPVATANAQVCTTMDRIYLIGGDNGTTQSNKVYCAVIAADGTISSWTESAVLPETFSRGQVLATYRRVYIFAGLFNGVRGTQSYYSDIAADGTLGAWVAGGALPVSVADARLVCTKRIAYLIGGTTAAGNANTYCKVGIQPDGSLGTWTKLTTDVTTNLFGVNSGALPSNVTSLRIVGKGGDGGASTTVNLTGSGSGTVTAGVTSVAITGRGPDANTTMGTFQDTSAIEFTQPFVIDFISITPGLFVYTGSPISVSLPAPVINGNYTTITGLPNGISGYFQYTWDVNGGWKPALRLENVPFNLTQPIGSFPAGSCKALINFGGNSTGSSFYMTTSLKVKLRLTHFRLQSDVNGEIYYSDPVLHLSAENQPATNVIVAGSTTVGGFSPGYLFYSELRAAERPTTIYTHVGDTTINITTMSGLQTLTFPGGRDAVNPLGVTSTQNVTLPANTNTPYSYSVPAGGTLGLAYQATVASTNTLSGSGTLNLPATTTSVSMTAKGADGAVVNSISTSQLTFSNASMNSSAVLSLIFGEVSGVSKINYIGPGGYVGFTLASPLTLGTSGSLLVPAIPGVTANFISSPYTNPSTGYSGWVIDIHLRGIPYEVLQNHGNMTAGLVTTARFHFRGYIYADMTNTTLLPFSVVQTEMTQSNGEVFVNYGDVQNGTYPEQYVFAPYATSGMGGGVYFYMAPVRTSYNSTGAATTFTLNGATYTFPGGTGAAATETTQTVTLPGTSAQTLNYTVSSSTPASVTYNHVTSGNGSPTTVTVNGTTYTFPGGVGAPATESTQLVTIPNTGPAYSHNVNTYGYARFEYTTVSEGSLLPEALSDFQTYTTANTAYILGGKTNTAQAATYTASIDYNGRLSAWTATTALPVATYAADLIAVKNKLYILGGANTTSTTPVVHYATILGGKNDYSGVYSSNQYTMYSSDFRLPDYSSIETPGSYYYIKT